MKDTMSSEDPKPDTVEDAAPAKTEDAAPSEDKIVQDKPEQGKARRYQRRQDKMIQDEIGENQTRAR